MKGSLIAAGACLVMGACHPDAKSAKAAAVEKDSPILPVTPGESWIYQVHLEIPEGVTSESASSVDTKFRRVRTYLGKRSAAEGMPETDCFEVTVPGFPAEREFVDIEDDRILMRGSLIMRAGAAKPMWLETPVPFVIAGVMAGDVITPVKTPDDSLVRRTEVLVREDITVPAGTFPCVHLLTTGADGELILSRSVWFSPGHGIIREEKTRYHRDQVVFHETQELLERNTDGRDRPPGDP
jgi:hypothetical protein